MAMRSMGTATVSFGLVSVPVKLYGATEARAGLGFNLLCRCGSRVKQQYTCESEGRVVPREEMVKGYEHSKGQFVTFTPEEVRALEESATGTIAIDEFVPESTVDPVHYDRAYYLAPDKGGAKAYALLAGALLRSGRVAVARYPSRGKDHLVALRATEGDARGPGRGGPVAITMQQVLRADEVRSPVDLEIPDARSAKVTDAEAQMADLLVRSIASDAFDPGKYPDAVKARFEVALAAKIAGAPPPAVEAPRAAPALDLMAALQASLAKAAGRR